MRLNRGGDGIPIALNKKSTKAATNNIVPIMGHL